MSNYYSSQRSIATPATGGNGRLIEITSQGEGNTPKTKTIAIFPFYMRKLGNINSWEFSATTKENDKEVGTMPKNFRAILFSCTQAFLDYMKNTYDKDFTEAFKILKHKVNKVPEKYFPPETYIEGFSDPGECIIIAAHSVRDDEEYSYPTPNCVHVGDTTGDRPYQGDDAEYFWRAEDGCYYFGIVEFDSESKLNLSSVRSVIYFQ